MTAIMTILVIASQSEFALHVGVCKTTIGKWECGLSHIPRKQYENLIAKGLIRFYQK